MSFTAWGSPRISPFNSLARFCKKGSFVIFLSIFLVFRIIDFCEKIVIAIANCVCSVLYTDAAGQNESKVAYHYLPLKGKE